MNLLYFVWDADPVMFQIGEHGIRWYGLLLAVGFLLGYIVLGRMSFGDPILYHRTNGEICIYNHDAGVIEADEKYSDFYSFLNDLWEVLGIGVE